MFGARKGKFWGYLLPCVIIAPLIYIVTYHTSWETQVAQVGESVSEPSDPTCMKALQQWYVRDAGKSLVQSVIESCFASKRYDVLNTTQTLRCSRKYSLPVYKLLPVHSNGQLKHSMKDYHNLVAHPEIIFPEGNITDKNDQLHIYLLAVHNNPLQLQRVIWALAGPSTSFLVFLDGSKSIETFIAELGVDLIRDKKLYFVGPRFASARARVGQLLGTILLMKAARVFFPDAHYYSFVSGADYPLLNSTEIVSFLEKYYPRDFLDIYPNEVMWRYHTRITGFLAEMPGVEFLKSCAVNILPKRIKFAHGSQWFTLSNKTSQKLIAYMEKHEDFLSYYDYVASPVESFFHTLYRSARLTGAYDYLRYINWKTPDPVTGHPRTLTRRDYEDIVSNPCHFWARKLSLSKDKKIFDMLDKYRLTATSARCKPSRGKMWGLNIPWWGRLLKIRYR